MIDPFYGKLIVGLALFALAGIVLYISGGKARKIKRMASDAFPISWRNILNEDINFYTRLNSEQKLGFEKRIQLFLASKKIEPVDTTIDERIKLMIAASAIIPMFAFPEFNYPNLSVVLVYPNSFDEKFQTEQFPGHAKNIMGMVGDRHLNGTMIISKPDLVNAYDGKNHRGNVGIHEFVHLVDKTDGATDGVPELFLKHAYVAPWLQLIKEEMERIEHGKSDINPYALTSNAEFLAVVSEYFFDDPEKFNKEHPDLYHYLSDIFQQKPNEKSTDSFGSALRPEG